MHTTTVRLLRPNRRALVIAAPKFKCIIISPNASGPTLPEALESTSGQQSLSKDSRQTENLEKNIWLPCRWWSWGLTRRWHLFVLGQAHLGRGNARSC